VGEEYTEMFHTICSFSSDILVVLSIFKPVNVGVCRGIFALWWLVCLSFSNEDNISLAKPKATNYAIVTNLSWPVSFIVLFFPHAFFY